MAGTPDYRIDALAGVRLEAEAVAGELAMTIGAVLRLARGETLAFAQAGPDTVELRVGGRRVARGTLALDGARLSLHVA